MSTWSDVIRLGVIRDAQQRRSRERRWLVAVVLATVVGGSVLYAAVGGASTLVPAPGQVTGVLEPLSPASYQYWVTPTLWPGGSTLDLVAQSPGASNACQGGCVPYVGRDVPIVVITRAAFVTGSIPVSLFDDPDVILLVAPDVAAVRVGRLGVVGAQPAVGLPTSDKVAAFKMPHSRVSRARNAVTLTALDAQGHALPAATPKSIARPFSRRFAWTSSGGACAASSTLPGLTDEQHAAAVRVRALPSGVPGVFSSCLDDKYSYASATFNVAILLDAHHPGKQLPPLWGAQPVPHHPAIVELVPPSQLPSGEDVTAPLYARRIDDAWLIVQARPGFAPNPAPAVRIRILESLRITRLDLSNK